jgi:hypothetical protein
MTFIVRKEKPVIAEDTNILSIQAKAHRTVTLTRGEDAILHLRFTPKYVAIQNPDEDPMVILKQALTSGEAIRLSKDGDVELANSFLEKHFTVEQVGKDEWEYDGGEVSTQGTRYRAELDILTPGLTRKLSPLPNFAKMSGKEEKPEKPAKKSKSSPVR